MRNNKHKKSHLISKRVSQAFFFAIAFSLHGCYMANWFKGDGSPSDSSSGGSTTGVVLGQSIGERAGNINEEELSAVYAITSEHAPAAIRPDPDIVVRNLIGQYRSPSVTTARTVGDTEPYRLLLGGASEDFSKTPQTEYDATSLLAVYAVAEDACEALVAPHSWRHNGWDTILPAEPSEDETNIRWLAQRITGIQSDDIDQERIDDLANILAVDEPFLSETSYENHDYGKYVSVCVALLLDAEALLL